MELENGRVCEMAAEVQELIIVEVKIGTGSLNDPVRLGVEVYAKDGKFIASYDPLAPTRNYDGVFILKAWHKTMLCKEDNVV